MGSSTTAFTNKIFVKEVIFLATLINEEQMIIDQAQQYEERMHSPLRRYRDQEFTPCRYWHIKGENTTLDKGWGDSAGVIGKNAALRYVMIDNLPLCGIETIIPQIQNDDFGLDTSYEGEATTKDGTIRPYENDFFMINYVKSPWIFRVTKVEYDKLASADKYKIQFTLEYINAEKVDALMKQTVGEYHCILENIGTDKKCIVERMDAVRIGALEKMYAELVDSFITLYHNKRYNCFLADFGNGEKLYDPFQEEFITKHRLLTRRGQIDGLVLSGQFQDAHRELKYQKSIYRYVELRKHGMLTTFPYIVIPGSANRQTAFSQWMDSSIRILDIPMVNGIEQHNILSEEFIDVIQNDFPTQNTRADLIKRYLREDSIDISSIDLNLHNEFLTTDIADLEGFFFTPILMYVIKDTINTKLARKEDHHEVEYFS